MKLAVVIERFDPAGGGGAERSTAQIVAELSARGHEVTIITAVQLEREAHTPCPVRPVLDGRRLGAWSLATFARRARRELATGAFDAGLSVTTVVPATVLQPRSGTVRETLNRNIALRNTAAGRCKKRIAIALSAKQQMLLRLEADTLRQPSVRRILAVSRYVSRQLRDLYDVDPAKIEILPNAASMPTVDPDQRLQWRRQVRAAFAVPEDQPVYLFAALNPRLKGLDPLLHAVRKVLDRGQGLTLLLAGDIGYATQRRAADLGIRDHVRFIGHTSAMVQLYCAADVTVLPTYYDPASKVVIESLMLGTCAITTSYNGAADLLVPPPQGTAPPGQVRGRVITEPADVSALAAAMLELADPAARQRCAAATAGLDQALSMQRHVDRLEAVLEEMGGGAVTNGDGSSSGTLGRNDESMAKPA